MPSTLGSAPIHFLGVDLAGDFFPVRASLATAARLRAASFLALRAWRVFSRPFAMAAFAAADIAISEDLVGSYATVRRAVAEERRV